MIKIVNFPFCNFHSLERYIRLRKKKYEVLDVNNNLEIEDILLIPGVGTFSEGMRYLKSSGVDDLIRNHAHKGGKIVGICLGMQLLLEGSDENPEEKGLSVIKGFCKKIPYSKDFSVPHIGWNSLSINKKSFKLIEEYVKDSNLSKYDYYFVHSFFANPFYKENIIANFEHPEGLFTAAIKKGQIIGFQFHPEKSGKAGYSLLDRVL